MAELTKILISLGINQTLWVQLGVFVVVFVIVNQFVFKPYFRAFLERQAQTTGSQDQAEQILTQTRELEALYQRKMRGLAADIKEVFDRARSEAASKQEKLNSEAREQAKNTIESGRRQIEIEYNKAREELLKETDGLSRDIAGKLISKEAH
jgi:F-type H+-transporting ATPase subunit b